MAFRNLLVLRGPTLLLRALGGEEVSETRRATHELTFGSQLEALGDGLFGLLHGNEMLKADYSPAHGKGNYRRAETSLNSPLEAYPGSAKQRI